MYLAMTHPPIFVSPDLEVLLKDMLDYMTQIATHIYDLASQMFHAPLEADLEKKLEKYKREVPVLSFNSAKYDIDLIKMELAKTLKLHETNNYFVVKKNKQCMCVANPEFRFLDISNILAPGYSYAKYLKAYQTEETKFYFPYEWFDDKRKLKPPAYLL